MALDERPANSNQSNFGSNRVVSGIGINSSGSSYIALLTSQGDELLLWVDANGKLRIGDRSAFDTAPDASGTIVGDQS